MRRKICIILLFLALFLSESAAIYAMCGSCGVGDSHESKAAAVNVNNTICPVSGDKVDMKNPTTIEYDGKVYNLCCPACIKEFKKSPEEYIGKIEKNNRIMGK